MSLSGFTPPLLRIAASVLLLVGLGTGLFFITRQNNKPHFTEKFEDPQRCYAAGNICT